MVSEMGSEPTPSQNIIQLDNNNNNTDTRIIRYFIFLEYNIFKYFSGSQIYFAILSSQRIDDTSVFLIVL